MTHPTASHNPATQCSKWAAIDAGNEDTVTALLKLSFDLRRDGVPAIPAVLVTERRTDSTVRSAASRDLAGIEEPKTHAGSRTKTPDH